MASCASSLLLGLLSFLIVANIASSSSSSGESASVLSENHSLLSLSSGRLQLRNGDSCGLQRIHIVMTLDANYLRGTMAAVLSILQHSTCPGKHGVPFSLALDQPLNYARIYLADIIPSDVKRVIYLDSDLVVVDDIAKLWEVDLEEKVLAAPEYCHANFTNYFSNLFWLDPVLAKTFHGRRPCYFNTGVMVVDVEKWRQGGITQRLKSG
ncbi:hypothetical protein H0E87_016693 [Populus deltoides]|uniref:Hexosyltransferase n=1 Tax=Populus deltoides TaxID=3696 RepID=A0A8T2YA27_POPDE|nr:hypothetical protein H0E87_016693 [Populus deltoides]